MDGGLCLLWHSTVFLSSISQFLSQLFSGDTISFTIWAIPRFHLKVDYLLSYLSLAFNAVHIMSVILVKSTRAVKTLIKK